MKQAAILFVLINQVGLVLVERGWKGAVQWICDNSATRRGVHSVEATEAMLQ